MCDFIYYALFNSFTQHIVTDCGEHLRYEKSMLFWGFTHENKTKQLINSEEISHCLEYTKVDA